MKPLIFLLKLNRGYQSKKFSLTKIVSKSFHFVMRVIFDTEMDYLQTPRLYIITVFIDQFVHSVGSNSKLIKKDKSLIKRSESRDQFYPSKSEVHTKTYVREGHIELKRSIFYCSFEG